MRTTAKITATGAWALALAALLAAPVAGDTHSRQGSDHARGSSAGHAVRGSGQGAPRSYTPTPQDRGPRGVPNNLPPGWRPDGQHGPRGVPNNPPPTWRSEGNRGSRGVPDNPPPTWRSDGRHDSRGVPNGWPPSGRYDQRRQHDGRYDGRDDWRRHNDRRYDGRYDRRYDGWRDGHHHYSFDGRVRRLQHGHGGYYFWLDDCDYPFWIPEARFLAWPLQLGLSVQFGGYWNPAGYYVYDPGPVAPTYAPTYGATSLLQGTFIGYDAATGVMTLRDDRTGRYVDVVLRGGDLDPRVLRTGDWIALSGAWNSGYFEAWRVENLRER
jgi:hypothetical protein